MESCESPDFIVIFLARSVVTGHKLFGVASLLGVEIDRDLEDLRTKGSDKELVTSIVETESSDCPTDCLKVFIYVDLHYAGK